ncbi:MAG: response regulator transcription factor [Terriglobales bacterium]
MAKILVIEDDNELAEVIEDWLTADHHVVERVNNGTDGNERLRFYQYDLVILDWNLPGMSGLEILRQYRKANGSTPILMLTGQREISHKEEGLDSGSDDYLTKPFDPRELSARIRALLRRPKQALDSALSVGDLVMETDKIRVTKGGKEISLAPREYALLEFFMRHPDQVFSQDVLLERVWSNDSDTTADSLRVHIKRLRSKLDTDGEESIIRTMHRQGYKLVTPGEH